MTPNELAARIAALDWFATSLQHQLAIGAAVTTLKALPIEHTCTAWTGNVVIGWSCKDCGKPRPSLSVTSNIVALHPTRTMRHVRLERLDGKLFATAGFLPGLASAPWAWIRSTVAADFECAAEQVGCAEGEDGDDLVTVDGLPVLRVSIGSNAGRSGSPY